MFSQQVDKPICGVCGCENFYKEDGYYFCSKCRTQIETLREDVLNQRFDQTTRATVIKIRTVKDLEKNNILGWTSWELYNFALIGIVDELIALGANSAIKIIALQLWANYLRKLEIAFTSTTMRIVPKLCRKYCKKDADIIYGKIRHMKKKRRRVSSTANSVASSTDASSRAFSKQKKLSATTEYDYINSQASSDVGSLTTLTDTSGQSSVASSMGKRTIRKFNRDSRRENKRIKQLSKNLPRPKRADFQKNFNRKRYMLGPQVLSLSKLWAIAFLALKIHDQNINISDMLRFGREGHLSYYRLDNLFPEWVKLSLEDKKYFNCHIDLTHRGLRNLVVKMAQFLEVFSFAKPNLAELIKQYCTELQLPRGVMLYAERLLVLSQPKMNYRSGMYMLPNYEARAMAFIIVVLKILFCLDGITEYKISKLAEKINRLALEKNVLESTLFSFREWQWYIECRLLWLATLHLPTKIKYEPEDNENNHLFIQFFESIKSSMYENDEKYIKTNLLDSFTVWTADMKNKDQFKAADTFTPSLTPMHTNLQELLQNPNYTLPDILKVNFMDTKVGYMTKPAKFLDLATQCNVKLKVVDSNLNFIEKKVPTFSTYVPKQVEKHKEKVTVEISESSHANKIENIIEFMQEKKHSVLRVDSKKQNLLSHFESTKSRGFNSFEDRDFCFDEIEDNGKLCIPIDDSDEDDNINNCTDPSVESLFDYEKSNLSNKLPSFVLRQNAKEWVCRRNRISGKKHLTKSPEKKRIKTEISNSESSSESTAEENFSRENKELQDVSSNITGSLSNLNNFNNFSDKNIEHGSEDFENCDIFLRPFKDYWIYYCDPDATKENTKQFKKFEKELPHSLNWLLNVCANILETSKADLYDEVCFVEAYFACKFNPANQISKSYKRVYQSIFKRIRDSW